jgi:flagellar biosynthesis protein FlhF
VVEITAGTGLRVPERKRPTARPVGSVAATIGSSLAGAVGDTRVLPALGGSQSGALVPPPGRDLLNSGAAGNIAVLAINKEMEQIRSAIRDLTHQIRSGGTPDVPDELFEHYRQLIEQEVAEELAREIIRKLKESIRPEHLANVDFVRDKIAEHVERLIPSAGPIMRCKSVGPHVVALIGPTGVGKTTTIAKLAAHLKLREQRRVGMITIDTYRIAAVDQLKRYAEILDAPLKVVNSPEEMRDAVAQMADCHFILIDTAGRSPRDSLKLGELRGFLSAASVDEVHLVLSSTMSQACVELAIERFGDVRFEKVIFTKLDEASHVGVVLNAVRRLNKALSYITTGQTVPADIEVGRGRRLAQMILEKGS